MCAEESSGIWVGFANLFLLPAFFGVTFDPTFLTAAFFFAMLLLLNCH
jgi:hypothetical protein